MVKYWVAPLARPLEKIWVVVPRVLVLVLSFIVSVAVTVVPGGREIPEVLVAPMVTLCVVFGHPYCGEGVVNVIAGGGNAYVEENTIRKITGSSFFIFYII
jgi:hypothetical protein